MNGVVQTIAGYFGYGEDDIEAGLGQLSLYGDAVPA